MTREVDPRSTRKAKRIVERLKRAAEAAPDPLSPWEGEFLEEVGQRLDKYGSAFRDLAKGAPEDAVSRLQTQKLKEIAAKASGKTAAKAAKQAEKQAAKRAAKFEEQREKRAAKFEALRAKRAQSRRG